MAAKTKTPRTQAERKEGTRRKILDAALETLLTRGYAGTSTWAICETGGFSKGTLLYHFKHKRQIFEAIMEDMTVVALTTLDDEMATATPADRRAVFLDWLWSTLDGDFFFLGLEIVNAARTDTVLLDVVRRGSDELIALIDHYIERSLEDLAGNEAHRMKTALQTTVHMVRGIGLDLAVGGDRETHGRQYADWRATVLEMA